MEEYHRDSLRELRRQAQEGHRQEAQKTKGSVFITLLIILLFLAAGGFYLKTSQPEWLEKYFSSSAVEQTLQNWKEDVASVFKSQETADVQQTVDAALSEQNEAA